MTYPNSEMAATDNTVPANVPAAPQSIAEHRTSEFHSASGRQLADEVASDFESAVHRLAPHLAAEDVEHAATCLREVLEERIDSLIDAYVFDAIEELAATEGELDEAGNATA